MHLLTRYRWLTVALPIALIGLVELVSDSVLDAALPFPADTILVFSTVAVAAIGLWWLAWRRIDLLTGDLDRRNRQLETRTATARALHQVSVAITAMAGLDEILETIAESARSLLRAEVALLVLAGPRDRPARRILAGSASWFLPETAGEDGPEGTEASGRGAARTELERFVRPEARVATLASPLQRGGTTIGSLAIGSSGPRAFDVDDVETLASLANQAAIAIENTRLHDELREVAVMAERERIAREMHDGLAQVLGYVNTKSQAVEELIVAGRSDDARAHLAELAAAARSIYVDVREAILGLTSPIEPGRGIVAPVEAYAARFAEAAKLAVQVRATQDAAAVAIAPEVQAHVFRIIQEALTNVRKHARAGRVEVRLDAEADGLLIEIADDGSGGSPAEPPPGEWPRYGARAMAERAAAIGATLAWAPTPGGGTTVRLRVPASGSPKALQGR